MNRLLALTAQIAACAGAFVADYYYPHIYLEMAFFTFLALAIVYFIFRIGLEEAIMRTVRDPKTRYSVRKATSILYVLVFILVVTRIWVEDSQTLLVSYGLIGAGIAIALQDFFKNFVGGILIFVTGIYRVGDRVEIESHYGDIIDIGLLYTTLLEIRGWVDGEQATGRLTIVPNGRVLAGTVNNYTLDHNFIWDEMSLPITYDSDWEGAVAMVMRIVTDETRAVTQQAEKEMASIMRRYYLSRRNVEPAVYITLTDNWINLGIRYISPVRERRVLRDRLFRLILAEIDGNDNIKIASETLDLSHVADHTVRFEGPGGGPTG